MQLVNSILLLLCPIQTASSETSTFSTFLDSFYCPCYGSIVTSLSARLADSGNYLFQLVSYHAMIRQSRHSTIASKFQKRHEQDDLTRTHLIQLGIGFALLESASTFDKRDCRRRLNLCFEFLLLDALDDVVLRRIPDELKFETKVFRDSNDKRAKLTEISAEHA
jgi:hypothetical protein